MAKAKEKEVENLPVATGGEVALTNEFLSEVSDYVENESEDFSSEDLITPRLRILQSMSPQVKKSHPSYVTSAEEGMIFNTATKELYNGGEGICVIPCYFNKEWIEWIPQDEGGGLVKRWGHDDSFKNSSTYKEFQGKWICEGNPEADGKPTEITITANYYVLLLNEDTSSVSPAILTLSGTEFKKSKGWNTIISMTEIVKPDGASMKAPIFWNIYKITTVPESNDKGSWFGYKIDKFKSISNLKNFKAVYEKAKEFRELVAKGKVKVTDIEQEEQSNESNTI